MQDQVTIITIITLTIHSSGSGNLYQCLGTGIPQPRPYLQYWHTLAAFLATSLLRPF